MENKDKQPIYYKNIEEMNRPISFLTEKLRDDITIVRGKIQDLVRSFGWEDRFSHIEGGLTCILVAMYDTVEEMKKIEERRKGVCNCGNTKYDINHLPQDHAG